MTGDLPSPTVVQDRASTVTAETESLVSTSTAVNVQPVGPFEAVELIDDGYTGSDAAGLAQLRAATEAVSAAEHACLHYPEPDHTADGPWILVSGLDGHLGTVHTGSATVRVGLDVPDGSLDARLTETRDRLEAVIDAARPSHDRYPVRADTIGAFTPGLTTFELSGVDATANSLTVEFAASITPATTDAGIASRFAECPGYTDVTIDRHRPVIRATPGDRFRQAMETATERVIGDWLYTWLENAPAFVAIPDGKKIALGDGNAAEPPFQSAEIERTTRILKHALSAMEAT